MYFAQRKLGWFWVDLPQVSIAGYGDYPQGGESPSRNLQLVESYIEMCREGFNSRTKVIKEFD
jgi:hypothetical protein